MKFVEKLCHEIDLDFYCGFWHFANNETAPEGDRLHKVQSLLSYLVTKFKDAKTPSNILAVDETMVPFRGRLKVRQYIPGKSHKYGVKLFKVCFPDGSCTYNISIYSGKMDTQSKGLGETVVLNLCEDYLDHGWTIVTNNFYTSVSLAERLLERKTHLVRTMRKKPKRFTVRSSEG